MLIFKRYLLKTFIISLFLCIFTIACTLPKSNKNISSKVMSEQTISITPTGASNIETAKVSEPTPTIKIIATHTLNLFSGINDYKIDNPKTYYNGQLKFGVEYPSAWEVNSEGEEATDLPNGDIENGIYIYVDSNKNDSIYVFNKGAHIFIPQQGLTSEPFTTEDGVDGEILYKKSEGDITIHLVLGVGFNGAYIIMSETSFEEYKEQIYAILKSIKISDDEK